MVIGLGADHGGFLLKEALRAFIKGLGHEALDLGAHKFEPLDDYPVYSEAVARAILDGKAQRGILSCGSGVGASIVANKFPGIRAALCHDTFSAWQGVHDDNMNVLCLGERIIGPELAKEIVARFLAAQFSSEEKYKRRLAQIAAIEEETMRRPKSQPERS
jgi:ribose 5-phosphate isomerase B